MIWFNSCVLTVEDDSDRQTPSEQVNVFIESEIGLSSAIAGLRGHD